MSNTNVSDILTNRDCSIRASFIEEKKIGKREIRIKKNAMEKNYKTARS